MLLGEQLRVLVVAHGDTVDGTVQHFMADNCYKTDEWCWAVFEFAKADKGSRTASIVDKNLIDLMSEIE